MKKQIEDFYFDMNLPVSAIINRILRDRIPSPVPCIQAALENIWKQIDKGEIEVKRNNIVKTVRIEAKRINASEKKEFYTRKYEGERIELRILRGLRIRYQNIQRANIHDLALIHTPYWVLIASVLAFVYFFGGN